MTQSGDEFNKLIDTMGQIKEIKYDNLPDMFEALKRNAEMLLVPLGNALMPILQQIVQFLMDNMPLIEGVIQQIAPVITDLFGQLLPPLMQLVQTIMPVIFDLIQQLVPFITQIVQAVLPVFVELLNMLLPPLMQIIEAVLPILMQLIQTLLPILQPLIELLQPIINLFMTLLQPLLELINIILPPLITLFTNIIQFILPGLQSALSVVASILGGVFSSAFNSVKGIIESVKNTFQNIIDFVRNVFTGNWSAAWENVKNIFSNIISGLGNIFKRPINFIIDGINTFIRGLNGLQIPDWVPGVGGLSLNLPTIPRLKVGMDYVPEDDFPALLHKGEAVLTKEENMEYRQAQSRTTENNNGIGSNAEYLIQKLIDILLAYFPQFKELMNREIVFEDGTVAARLTPLVDRNLSDEETKRRRGN